MLGYSFQIISRSTLSVEGLSEVDEVKVLRALGVLGALDPFKFKLYSGQVDTYSDTGIAVSHHEVAERKDGKCLCVCIYVFLSALM
ncbi:unnamed protein product [Trichobilharzia regenti]|nr:unnamed protein product [Trichobilharzia regenti]